ncbi:MAG: STAS-like domain-containing protein [Methanobacteriaceae archaeon]
MSEYEEIFLEKEISENLGIRHTAERLFNKLNHNKSSNVVMNFDNVEFMSRSFAQEYVFQKEHSELNITEKNIPYNVKMMLEVVYDNLK